MRTALVMFGLIFAAVGAWLLLAPTNAPQPTAPMVAAQPVPSVPTSDEPRPWFDEVAEQVGIDFRHVTGFDGKKRYMPESMAGGVCLIDFDGDGWLDVYFVQGGRIVGADAETPGNRLFRNMGDGTFDDVTDRAGVGDKGYGMGCTTGDFDNDGHPDLYVTNVGPNVLYRNNGDGTFADATARAGVGEEAFSSSSTFVDYDHDGDLDLFVVNYIRWSPEHERDCKNPSGQSDYCSPNAYGSPAPDKLYRNDGDATFTDVTEASGLSAVFGNGLGVVCADFNGDGLIDFAVGNDLAANQLWLNGGESATPRFRNGALERGVAYNGEGMAESGMGVDAPYLTMPDGKPEALPSLFMTHFDGQTNTLWINDDGYFTDATMRRGLEGSLPFTGFGTAFADLDNDTLLDIYVANGRVEMGRRDYNRDAPYAEPNQVYRGLAGGRCKEVMPRGGTREFLVHSSRGAAFGDFDNDGDIDLFVVNRDGPAYVLRNLTNTATGGRSGAAKHWIIFRVQNAHGADAIGATVRIESAGHPQSRDVRTAYSYCSGNDPRVHFGLGKSTAVDSVRVTWPDHTTSTFGPFEADRIVDLRQAEQPKP